MNLLVLDLGRTTGYAHLVDTSCTLGITKKLDMFFDGEPSITDTVDLIIVESVSSLNRISSLVEGRLERALYRSNNYQKLIYQPAYYVRTMRKAVKERFPKLRLTEHERDALCHLWAFISKRNPRIAEEITVRRIK